MTHHLITRFRRPVLAAALTVPLIAGTATAALAGGGGHEREHVKPHCVIVALSGSTQFAEQEKHGHQWDGGKAQEETYSATATALVCEGKHGDLKLVKIFNGAADETEAQDHGGK